jgi:hypothetical protein
MNRYRYTSENFILSGETGDSDAVMHPDDLVEIKRLAGILPTIGEALQDNSQQSSMSPVGSNISITGNEKRQLEKSHGIRPGTDEW